MINLNKEAEEYCIKIVPRYDTIIESNIRYFIAGANSKYVKQQILQAQIDILESTDATCVFIYGDAVDINIRIEQLQQELKQLDL